MIFLPFALPVALCVMLFFDVIAFSRLNSVVFIVGAGRFYDVPPEFLMFWSVTIDFGKIEGLVKVMINEDELVVSALLAWEWWLGATRVPD